MSKGVVAYCLRSFHLTTWNVPELPILYLCMNFGIQNNELWHCQPWILASQNDELWHPNFGTLVTTVNPSNLPRAWIVRKSFSNQSFQIWFLPRDAFLNLATLSAAARLPKRWLTGSKFADVIAHSVRTINCTTTTVYLNKYWTTIFTTGEQRAGH